MNGYSAGIGQFLIKYYQSAQKCGSVGSGSLPEPVQGNLDYYHDVVGPDFQVSLGFLEQSLKRWIPALGMKGRRDLAIGLYDVLNEKLLSGLAKEKVKLLFVKYMTWMNGKFRQMIPMLGSSFLPKMLYIGCKDEDERRFFSIVNAAGCDILLLQPEGDAAYLALDPTSSHSQLWKEDAEQPFPPGFSLGWLGKKALEAESSKEPVQGTSSPRPRQAAADSQRYSGRPASGTQHYPYMADWDRIQPEPAVEKTKPAELDGLFANTSAYEAERELDTMLYENSGLYRVHQYGQANSVFLKMTYEELFLLWDKDLKLRPSFSAADGKVQIPVLFAKVSGVAGGDLASYWRTIGSLWTKETILIRKIPFSPSSFDNPFSRHALDLIQDGRLLRNRIRQLREYQQRFGMLREETQSHILDKIQFILDKRLIQGIGTNGREYAVIAASLGLDQEILRKIQSFDFTKSNPKLLVVHVSEQAFSLEDAVTFLLLALIGFDVALFVPTGYQTVERYYTMIPFRDFQAGEYYYDLPVPEDIVLRQKPLPKEKDKGAFEKLLGKFSHGKK